ncbi:uncharacterized protein LOC135113754 [Scylla paramamosain]|uniref:uncharacterized protein LOC135113754 n=1 Tax=Scylla paramamosain TaxID=85552 RepID=UPI0030832D63
MASTGLTAPACLVVMAMAAWCGGTSNTTHETPPLTFTHHNHTKVIQDMADKATHIHYSVLGVSHKLREEKERKLLDGDQEDDASGEESDLVHDFRPSGAAGVSEDVRVVSGASLNALYELYALASYIASVSNEGKTSSELKGASVVSAFDKKRLNEIKGSDTAYASDKNSLNEKKGAGIASSSDKKRLNKLKGSENGHLNALYTLYSLVNYVRGEVVHIETAKTQERKGKQKRTTSEADRLLALHGENRTREASEEADSEAGEETGGRKWSLYVVVSVSVLVVVMIILLAALCIVRFCRRAVFSFGSRRPIVRGMCSPVK